MNILLFILILLRFSLFSFKHFPTKFKSVYAIVLPIRLSVRALVFLNIFRRFWNWDKLFRFTIKCFEWKKGYMGLTVRVQRLTKEFRYITVNGRNDLKVHLNMLYYTKCNEISMNHSEVQSIFSIKKWYWYF